MRALTTTISCVLIVSIGVVSAQSGPQSSKRPPVPPDALTVGKIVPIVSPSFKSRWALTLPQATQVQAAGGTTNLFISTDTMPIRAYSVAHGRPVWRGTLKADMPMVTGDDLVFVTQGGTVHALEQATGRERWTISTGPLAVAPTWQPQWLFTASKDGTIAAWRIADGAQIWKQPLGSPASGRVSVDGDHLFAGLEDKRLLCLRISADGKIIWSTALNAVAREITAIAGRLYFGAADYTFYSVKEDTGGFEWPPHRSIHATVVGRPVLDADHIWIATLNNRADALSRGNGEIDLIKPLLGRPAEQILIEGGEVIVPLDSGDLLFFSQKDGKPLRPPPPPAPPAAGAAPPPPPPAKYAARFPLYLTLPSPDGETPEGATAFPVPAHAAMPIPLGTALVAPLFLAGPANGPVMIRVTLGADAVHTVTAFERDKPLDPQACIFAWAGCGTMGLSLPLRK